MNDTNYINVSCPPRFLWLGREQENNYRSVTIDCANWFEAYPNATITAYYQPYAASDPYPLVLTADGTKRIWHPTATELVKGNGELQIVLMLGDVVGTSAIIPTRVDRSLISSADHPAEGAPSWTVQVVQDVTEQADRAEEAASHYPKIVNGVWYVWSVQAEDFVSTGIEAQGEDGYSPTVTVTEIDGGHRVTITDADGAHTFDVMDGESSSGGGAVESVNGKTGTVVLDASDVGALSDDTQIPSKTSDLTNDSGFVTAQQAAASAPVQSVNGKTGAVSLGAADVHALPDSTVIPPTVTEQTVAGWGFTKNTGDYTKPSTGIPASDLAQAVQASLSKADTALQQHQSLTGYATETWVQNRGYQTAAQVQAAVEGVTPFEIPFTTTGLYAPWVFDSSKGVTSVDIFDAVYAKRPIVARVETNDTVEIISANLAQADKDTEYRSAYIEFWTFGDSTANDSEYFFVNMSVEPDIGDPTNEIIVDSNHRVKKTLPAVTASDNGKFLRVVNGAWAAATVQTWQGGSY